MDKFDKIHTIQKNHFTKPTKDWTDKYQVDEKDLEKYLSQVEKEFLKKERESWIRNKKDYLDSINSDIK